jgi:hypothetical protein
MLHGGRDSRYRWLQNTAIVHRGLAKPANALQIVRRDINYAGGIKGIFFFGRYLSILFDFRKIRILRVKMVPDGLTYGQTEGDGV